MSVRDREVLEELRDDPELLALADAVIETQRMRHQFRPWGVLTVAALAAALFLLVLAAPWDRGGHQGTVLDRAFAAVPSGGPVAHMTIRLEPPGASPITTQTYYDKERRLLRVVTSTEESPYALADYTTRASEDEFVTFPGLLDVADYYRKALAAGRAEIVGRGAWRSRPVYWVRLKKGGRLLVEVGVDRDTYRPLVFRGLTPGGQLAGYQVAVLGLDYVSRPDAHFQLNAPILVTGRVLGPNCHPTRARVGASLKGSDVEVTSARSGSDGRFVLRVDPRKSPFQAAAIHGGPLEFTLVAEGNGGFAFRRFRRDVTRARWIWHGKLAPLTLKLSRRSAPGGC